MPTEGFKSQTLKEDTVWKLKELAARNKMSVPDFVEKLVNDFEVHEV